jgi:hypothetical protein
LQVISSAIQSFTGSALPQCRMQPRTDRIAGLGRGRAAFHRRQATGSTRYATGGMRHAACGTPYAACDGRHCACRVRYVDPQRTQFNDRYPTKRTSHRPCPDDLSGRRGTVQNPNHIFIFHVARTHGKSLVFRHLSRQTMELCEGRRNLNRASLLLLASSRYLPAGTCRRAPAGCHPPSGTCHWPPATRRRQLPDTSPHLLWPAMTRSTPQG